MSDEKKAVTKINTDAIEKALMQGDLSRLDENQKLSYYKHVCDSVGLNALTKPFEYMKLNGKEVLYAGKNCAEQLRKIHNISIYKIEKENDKETYNVTAYARMPDGREDASLGSVNIFNLKGDALCNAKMKCETKAKRRVTLSIVGLGMLDETEVETIKGPTPIKKNQPEQTSMKTKEKDVVSELKERKKEVDTDWGDHAIKKTPNKHVGKRLYDIPQHVIVSALEYWAPAIKSNRLPLSIQNDVIAMQKFLEQSFAETTPRPEEPMPSFDSDYRPEF